MLEMRAMFLDLKHFFPHLKSYHVLVCTDKTTVVSNKKQHGGLHSHPLFRQVQKKWAETKLLFLIAVYIPAVTFCSLKMLRWF